MKSRVQPQDLQKVTVNSFDEDLELDFGKNFKYELHPEEKLSLIFQDWNNEHWMFLEQIFLQVMYYKLPVLVFQQFPNKNENNITNFCIV